MKKTKSKRSPSGSELLRRRAEQSEPNYRNLVEIIKETAPKLCETEKADFGWVLPLYVFLLRSLRAAAEGGDTRCLKFLAAIGSHAYFDVMAIAGQGNELAAALVSEDLLDLTRQLLTHCYIDPKPFRAVARNKIAWPGVKTCTNDEAEDWETIRQRIELGRDTGLKFDGKLATQRGSTIARRLYRQLQIHRESRVSHYPETIEKENSYLQDAREREAEALRKLPTFKFDRRDEREFLLGESAAVFRAWCLSLPVLSKDKAVLKEWCKAARVAFEVEYGQQFEDDRKFAGYWSAIKNRAMRNPAEYGKDYQQRNAVRSWIWKDIVAGLQSIAAQPTEGTKTP